MSEGWSETTTSRDTHFIEIDKYHSIRKSIIVEFYLTDATILVIVDDKGINNEIIFDDGSEAIKLYHRMKEELR